MNNPWNGAYCPVNYNIDALTFVYQLIETIQANVEYRHELIGIMLPNGELLRKDENDGILVTIPDKDPFVATLTGEPINPKYGYETPQRAQVWNEEHNFDRIFNQEQFRDAWENGHFSTPE